jgi:peptidoglycan/xylan/chitin deacetylase (PgdA/CDA1 family)
MALVLPHGKRLVVALSADFDAQSLWMAAGLTSPSYLSRGEFGAEVGLPRVLELLRRHEVVATFCTPGHSLLTYPSQIEAILAGGHELAAHGCYHEQVPSLDEPRERELLDRQIEQHIQVVGQRPRGYRSPSWDFSDKTLALLEEFGFEWDSSLMGRDFVPYHPRPVTVDFDNGNTFGPASPILEIPVSWYLDDFPFVEYVPSIGLYGSTSAQMLLDRWTDAFDYAVDHVPNGVFGLTVHPQTIGRAQHISILEKLIIHMQDRAEVLFATLSDVRDYWQEEDGRVSD